MQDRQRTYKVTWRRVRATARAVAEHYVLHILGVCVSTASVVQDAKRMRRITLPSVDCPAVPNFFHIIL